MNNFKLIDIVLAPFSLFAFLFYIFWTYPVQILSQELPINEYHIFNNGLLLFSLSLCLIILIILYFSYKYSKFIYKSLISIIIFGLIITLLYKYIFSFQFGSFIDNISLVPEKSLTNFNPLHYVLDIIFFIASIGITIIIICKNLHKQILLLFFIFYSVENTTTLASLKLTSPLQEKSMTITLSQNHPNLLFFMYDSVSLPIIRRMIEIWTPEQKSWTKDFTFYDNVTSLSLSGTMPSLPSMIGGYQFSKQIQLKNIIQNNYTINPERKGEFYPTPSYFYTDQAFQNVYNKLNQNISIQTMDFTDSFINTNENLELPNKKILTYKTPPIISVSLYQILPYILRKYITSTPYEWKGRLNIKWISYINNILLETKTTDKPVFYFLENIGNHAPFYSPTSPITISQVLSSKDLETVLIHQLDYNMLNMNTIINFLKNKNIYDSTRIIVTSDHGISPYISEPRILPYLQSLSSSNHKRFYTGPHEYLQASTLPVFIMNKGFNTTQTQMQTDSRFLSLGDLHNSIISTFSNSSKQIDYLYTIPLKRQFNIPLIHYQTLEYLAGNQTTTTTEKYKEFLTNDIQTNMLPYYQITSIKEGNFKLKHFNYDKIEELPPFEVIE